MFSNELHLPLDSFQNLTKPDINKINPIIFQIGIKTMKEVFDKEEFEKWYKEESGWYNKICTEESQSQ